MTTARRRQRMADVAAERTRWISLVLDGVHDPHNIAAVLRSADAFGVQEVHAVETPERLRIANNIARGTQHWVDLYRYPSVDVVARQLQSRGYALWVAAAEPGARSLWDWDPAQPTAFVFGNEHRGVSPALRDLADATFQIPMVGMVESLNVSVACALTLAMSRHALAQTAVTDAWRLDATAQSALVTRWCERTGTEQAAS